MTGTRDDREPRNGEQTRDQAAVIDSLALVGLLAHGSSAQDMAADQKAEFERWAPLVKQIGFTAEN